MSRISSYGKLAEQGLLCALLNCTRKSRDVKKFAALSRLASGESILPSVAPMLCMPTMNS
jgi:hypothetical protein